MNDEFRFNGLFVGRGACQEVAGRLNLKTPRFNGLFVGRGAAPCNTRMLDSIGKRFNGLFVGRGAAPLSNSSLYQGCTVSMASSSAGALRPGRVQTNAFVIPWFQWPLRRPGRCALDFRPADEDSAGFNGLFVGRGAAPWLLRWQENRRLRFQWPLRRPGRCAAVCVAAADAIDHCFNGLFVGRGAAPAIRQLQQPEWAAEVSMASSSAGALRQLRYGLGDGYEYTVSMASSSAGALRRKTTLAGNMFRSGFQWPLRRPGRCASQGQAATEIIRVSMASSSAGALRQGLDLNALTSGCSFNGLFVGRGAAPETRRLGESGEDAGFNGLFVGRGAAPTILFDHQRHAERFNGLFVGRGAAPFRSGMLSGRKIVSMASSSAGALRRQAGVTACTMG